jgi:hypothetical protein
MRTGSGFERGNERESTSEVAFTMNRLQRVWLGFLVLAVFESNLAWAKRGDQPDPPAGASEVSPQDSKGGFGRPETITGTVMMVKAEEGIVVLAVTGQSQAPSTVVVVHSRSVQDGDSTTREEEITAVPGPGETDFSFRVDRWTLVKVDGHRVALGELGTLKGREATIRFVPRRAGNFALGIEVG